MLPANKNSIISSFLILMPFISFYCLIALARASSAMYIGISFHFLASFLSFYASTQVGFGASDYSGDF